MRSLSLILMAALCLLGSCQLAKRQKALEFSNKMSAITDSLYRKGSEWGAVYASASQDRDYSKLKPLRLDMEQFTDRSITAVASMKDVAGSEQFRADMLGFLRFEKNMIGNVFSRFEQLNAGSREEEIQAVLDALTESSTEETRLLDVVRRSQNEFARKNGFQIQNKNT